jgi:hypothetical protein
MQGHAAKDTAIFLDRDRFMRAHPSGFLTRPFSGHELLAPLVKREELLAGLTAC